MKVFLLFFIYTVTLAQSSVLSEKSPDSKKILLNSIEDVKPLPSALFELKLDRGWLRDSVRQSVNKNMSSTIRFKGSSENFIDSDLFIIVVSSAVAFGAAAAYFKLESDNYYDKYLLTNNKSYKNKTDRYDLYSGVALGVMEINFGFLVYKFLTD